MNWITAYQMRCFERDGKVLLTARTNKRIWEQRRDIEKGLRIEPEATDMALVRLGPPMIEQVLFDRRRFSIEDIRRDYSAL